MKQYNKTHQSMLLVSETTSLYAFKSESLFFLRSIAIALKQAACVLRHEFVCTQLVNTQRPQANVI